MRSPPRTCYTLRSPDPTSYSDGQNYGGDTTGVLEEVDDRGVVVRHEIVEIEADSEIEAEIEADLAAELQTEIEAGAEIQVQSIFYPWAKINWIYHPE